MAIGGMSTVRPLPDCAAGADAAGFGLAATAAGADFAGDGFAGAAWRGRFGGSRFCRLGFAAGFAAAWRAQAAFRRRRPWSTSSNVSNTWPILTVWPGLT